VQGSNLRPKDYEKDGEGVYGYNFVVQEFDFGAPGPQKREQLGER
jgi:single-strand DNA-binding protein